MILLSTLLLPAITALLLCLHLGYAWATLLLPDALRAQRAALMPIIGLALLLVATAALTTTTALTPPLIVGALALLALPVNAWALLRRRGQGTGDRGQGTGDRGQALEVRSQETRAHPFTPSPLHPFTPSPLRLVVGLALLLFTLAVLPAARSGSSAPIGKNWDAADFYVPLGRMLQLVSQRDLATLPRNPLVGVVSEPPVSGRIHAFSYLHAVVSSATGVEPLRSFVPLMAFLLALCPLAVWALGGAVGLTPRAALLMTALVALGWLPLWVTYNSFANHLLALPLLWFALAAGVVALRAGGRAALATGALAAAALATGYYPAMSAYVALLLPAFVWMLYEGGLRPGKGRAWFLVLGLRLVALGCLALLLSLPAQYYFFFKDGFLDEALKSGIGYRIDRYVSAAEALGLVATLRGEGVAWPALLTGAGVAAALLLGALTLARRHAPLLAALLCGALLYQALMVGRGYYYGFYKGVTFALPVFAGLLAAAVDDLTSPRTKNQESKTRTSPLQRVLGAWPSRSRRIIVSACHLVMVSLLLGLNAATLYRVAANYSASGARLWSADELAVAAVRAAVPRGASVLLVAPDERAPTFTSLASYALLGNRMYGKLSTAYGTLSNRPKETIPDMALLPERADPTGYGYRLNDLRWTGAGMRLYARGAGLRYHRTLGEGGRYPQIAPGETLTLRIGAGGIVLPKERTPDKTHATARLALAAASFGPSSLRVGNVDYDLPGGMRELDTVPLGLPSSIELRNTGAEPIFLWWGELRDPAAQLAPPQRASTFVQMLPQARADGKVFADLRLHTPAQALTAVLTIHNRSQRAAQWVFALDSGTFRLDADLQRLAASVTKAGRPIALSGAAQPSGDGDYAATLSLASNGQVIYDATLWRWTVRGGALRDIETDTVLFDVLALPVQ